MKRAVTYFRTLYRNRNGLPDMPRLLTFIVTFKCNARCVMCDSWKKGGHDDLSLDEIESIMKQLPVMDAVRLSGGEPFVRKDFPEILELTRRHLKPFGIHVTTNGFLTEKIVETCANRKKGTPLYVMISIDGMAEKHNQIRGRDYAWENAMATISELAPRQNRLNLKLFINQTIVDEESMDQYRRLRDYIKKYDIIHNIVLAYDTSATYNSSGSVNVAPRANGEFTTYGSFCNTSIGDFLNQVQEDLKYQPLLERKAKEFYLNGIKNRVLYQKGHPNPNCVALKSHLRIFPDGTVPVCQFNTTPVGNLRTQEFPDIWRGKSIQKHRNWVSNCPGCWAECEVLPNAIYSGDLLKYSFLSRKAALLTHIRE